MQNRNRPFADGRGSWEDVTAGIAQLIQAIPGVTGHAVLTGETDQGEVRLALTAAGFTDMTLLPVTASLFGDVVADRPEEEAALDAYLELIAKDAEDWLAAIRLRDAAELTRLHLTTGLGRLVRALLYDIKRRFPCGAGLGMVGIDARGSIYPCHRFVGQEDYRIGHISSGTPDRDGYRLSFLSASEECATCFARYTCSGGCKHDSASTTAAMYKPATRNCRLRRHELKMAAWVVAQLTSEDRAFAAATKVLPSKPCPLDL